MPWVTKHFLLACSTLFLFLMGCDVPNGLEDIKGVLHTNEEYGAKLSDIKVGMNLIQFRLDFGREPGQLKLTLNFDGRSVTEKKVIEKPNQAIEVRLYFCTTNRDRDEQINIEFELHSSFDSCIDSYSCVYSTRTTKAEGRIDMNGARFRCTEKAFAPWIEIHFL